MPVTRKTLGRRILGRRILGRTARRLAGATGANVAVIFALSTLPLLAFAGAAVDYGVATRLQVKLQAATDATALGLCQTPQSTTTQALQGQAAIVVPGYMGAGSGVIIDPLGVTSSPRKITLVTHINSKTFFPAFTHVSSPQVTASSQCATPLPKTFEIALVLDNTGSMSESSGSQSKLQAVQQAADNFVDYVKGNGAFSPDSRISVVPFAATVAVDPSATATASWVDTAGRSKYHWTNVDKGSATAAGFTSRLAIFAALKKAYTGWDWGGCFESLPYPLNVQDGAPNPGNGQPAWDTLYVPLFAPDEPGGGSSGYAAWNPASNQSSAYTNYSFNSYIDDSNGKDSCPASSNSFASAESQACKYVSAKNARPTTYNNYMGLPNGPNFQCVSKPLQRLTTDATALKTLINSMTAAGSTNIHEGVEWGWRTLSPISVFADGAAYAATTTSKVMVVMTDGANSWPDNPYNNFNQTMYFSNGYLVNADNSTPAAHLPSANQNVTSSTQQRNAIDALTLEACNNAKATGISVYTVGFSVPSDPIDNQGIQLLQNCASNSKQAFVANDSDGLITAFNQIAASIGALRISQ